MTNIQALQAALEPYVLSDLALEKALTDASLVSTDTYSSAINIAKAAIKALKQLLVLSSESEGGFAASYSLEGIKARIKSLCLEHNLTGSEYSVEPTISAYKNRW